MSFVRKVFKRKIGKTNKHQNQEIKKKTVKKIE